MKIVNAVKIFRIPLGGSMRFHQLDTLRFVLALYIVGGHVTGWSGLNTNAELAVDFFFILSGFVLAQAIIERGPSWPSFAVARFARLWPLHILTMCAALFFVLKLNWFVVSIHVLMLQNAGIIDELTLNAPAWSVSSEMIIGLLVLYPIVRFRLLALAGLLAVVCAVILLRTGLQTGQHVDHLTAQPLADLIRSRQMCDGRRARVPDLCPASPLSPRTKRGPAT